MGGKLIRRTYRVLEDTADFPAQAQLFGSPMNANLRERALREDFLERLAGILTTEVPEEHRGGLGAELIGNVHSLNRSSEFQPRKGAEGTKRDSR